MQMSTLCQIALARITLTPLSRPSIASPTTCQRTTRLGVTSLITGALLGLPACTGPGALTADPTPPPRPTIIVDSTPTPKPALPTVSDAEQPLPEFSCEPVPPVIIAEVEAMTIIAQSEFTTRARTAEDWVLVHIGEGSEPGETWSIVGLRTHEPREAPSVRSSSENQYRNFGNRYFLTNVFSEYQPSGSTWINVGNPAIHPDAALFQTVNWTGAQREIGLAAQLAAQDCLD